MSFPKFGKSNGEGGVFDNLKQRFGGGTQNASRQTRSSRRSGSARTYDTRTTHDDFDEYGNYDDYDDYDEAYAEEFAEYGPDYDDKQDSFDDMLVRSERLVAPSAQHSSVSSNRSTRPHLISIDDVRAHTQVPERLNRDPLPARCDSAHQAAESARRGRTFVENDNSYTSAAHTAPMRSEGLESLFEPSDKQDRASVTSSTSSSASTAKRFGNEARPAFSAGAEGSNRTSTAFQTGTEGSNRTSAAFSEGTGKSYDPYEAYSSTAPSTHTPARSLSVLRPVTYGDAQRIAKVLKSGDVVILALRKTSADLSKRILDFSFGVASALDASVECPGEKVFAIVPGEGLTSAELQALRDQGVL